MPVCHSSWAAARQVANRPAQYGDFLGLSFIAGVHSLRRFDWWSGEPSPGDQIGDPIGVGFALWVESN